MGKPERKRPLLKPRLRWKDDNKVDFQKIKWVNGLITLRRGTGTGSCECGNELPGSIRCGEIFANWHSPATLTGVFPCFLLSCKANARVYIAKTAHGPHSS